ncbi:unnamed protein product [Gongylonema pulchrum]|uniref:Uncharacterized protein n=1 Tax=Gongylonema pulchrum TaxID=637853 RepID=A0A183DTI6_9BILA|nr:unnamed protein product [Gongylonema pulchrum]
MLAFSEFEFIVKYFFIVLSALILIGLINGLMLLPVLLSLIGPPCEIRPFDGKSYLPVPPPLNRKRQCSGNMNDDDDPLRIRVGGAFVEMQVNGGTKPSKKNIHIFHDSLSTITEESSEVRLSLFPPTLQL